MNKSDYYLLHVLSRPPVPVPVANPASHNWKTGDVISGRFEQPLTTERLLILDVNHDGQLMALQLSDEPNEDEQAIPCFSRGPDAPEGCVSESELPSHWVSLDKVWFGYEIIPQNDNSNTLKLSSRLTQDSLAGVKEALLALWLETGKSAAGLTLIEQGRDFQTVTATIYQLQRFLNFIDLSFDETDYTVLRNFLHLPKEDIKKPRPLDCNCEEHQAQRNSAIPHTYAPKNFLNRAWAKMVNCVKKLELEAEPNEVLEELSKTAHCLKWQAGSSVPHAFIPRPCYIQQLPTELLLNIIEAIPLHWERATLLNFGLTCKFFYQLVNVSLYASIALSCTEEKWDKVVRMLPKHGHLTREIYLEAPLYDDQLLKRVVFDNLRAIGDYCPNLERLDLNYPMRLDLTATEADLPPKLIVEPPIEPQADDTMVVEAESELTASEDYEMEETDNDGDTAEQPAQGNHGEDEENDNNNDNDDNVADGAVPQQVIGGQLPNIDEAARHYAAQQVARQTALQAAYEEQRTRQKRVCAELDYIIENCPLLNVFSLQWTGHQALERFYHKIPKLKGLRLWDRSITDQSLIATGTNCRDLERFYFDGQDARLVTLNGLIGMLNALHTKKNSKLRRLGLFYPIPFRSVREQAGGMVLNDFDDDDEDGMGEDDPDEMDDDDANDDDDEDAHGEGNEVPLPPVAPPPPPPQPHFDVTQSPLYKYLEVLSAKHPFLERLALIGCTITDDIIPILGNFEHLQSVDLHQPNTHHPHFQGLSAVGCTRLVEVCRGRNLSSLDLSGHVQISEDDMNILTGPDGLKSLRYIRVFQCPKLKGRYLCDEWVHPEDFVNDGGRWRPRDGAGKGALEIGDGWKEQWGE